MELIRVFARRGLPVFVAAGLGACAMIPGSVAESSSSSPADASPLAAPSAPMPPANTEAPAVHERAANESAMRIVISLQNRHLWLLSGRDTVMSARVGIGTGQNFSYNGRTWTFKTPRGQRTIVGKETNPIWTPPDWHYFEKAKYGRLTAVQVQPGQTYGLSDGSYIEMRGNQVGRVNQFGNFWAFTPGSEIIFDGKIFIPPLGSAQRRVPNALGTHKLDMGDGFLIHGTNIYTADSIGGAVSHGCVRMHNEDVARLYSLVSVGTPVYIF
jgi:hypothetical protein